MYELNTVLALQQILNIHFKNNKMFIIFIKD